MTTEEKEVAEKVESEVVASMGLRLYPDPILSKVSEPVTEFDEELGAIIDKMYQIMTVAQGVGLAAPQAGLSKRIITWRVQNEEEQPEEGCWINPVILSSSEETQTLQEGCLSFPGISLGITRSLSVELEYYDMQGEKHTQVYDGLLAQIAQHEIEHLQGIVFIKDLSRLKKDVVLRKMRKFKKKAVRLKKEYERQMKQYIRTAPPEVPKSYDFSIQSEEI